MSVTKRDYREENITRSMEKCVHFTGISNSSTCAAGIAYSAVTVKHDPMPYKDRWGHEYKSAASLPCLGGNHNLVGATCDKRCTLTREQAEAKQAERERFIAQMATARQAIVENIKATGSNGGSITCPSCKTGTLGYSRAASNGHIWAKCSTPDCLSWIE